MSDQETAGVVGSPAQPVEASSKPAEPKFNKQQLINSKKYQEWRDLLNVVLDDADYTFAEVDAAIEKFMKKEFDKKEVTD